MVGAVVVAEKIAEYEHNGWFDRDIYEDPPTKPLKPRKLDLLHRKFRNKVKCYLAYRIGFKWLKQNIKSGQFVLDGVEGLENLEGFTGGAVVTCNHISVTDHFAILLALKKHFRDLRNNRMYKIIREGNYAQKGFVGRLMRHCDTLPVNEEASRNLRVTIKTLQVVRQLLPRGKKILIYPEQALWPHYRKPRPMKSGAFVIASKNLAPLIPCFITMRATDVDYAMHDGKVQAYTVHIGRVIYPDALLSTKENATNMQRENEKFWRETYERVYGEKLR